MLTNIITALFQGNGGRGPAGLAQALVLGVMVHRWVSRWRWPGAALGLDGIADQDCLLTRSHNHSAMAVCGSRGPPVP